MCNYILKRLLLMIPTGIGIITVFFVISEFVPGGPLDQIEAMISMEADSGDLAGFDAEDVGSVDVNTVLAELVGPILGAGGDGHVLPQPSVLIFLQRRTGHVRPVHNLPKEGVKAVVVAQSPQTPALDAHESCLGPYGQVQINGRGNSHLSLLLPPS